MCRCTNCSACKRRQKTYHRVRKFRALKKGLTYNPVEISDEELEQKLNEYYESIKDPDYYKLRIVLENSTNTAQIPSWIEFRTKWRTLRSYGI